MSIFIRANDKWLRHRVVSQINEKHKDLLEPFYKSIRRKVVNFISDSKQWWFIFLFVLAIVITSPFINFEILNVLNIKAQTAVYIVDQRTANIATIISITLVVVGFILNNLAVKSPLVYGLLFKESLLYPIIYLTLTVIGFFIAISTLRDTLPEYAFTRIVLTLTYFAFIILFLIGVLFRKVFLFSNEKEIEKMLEAELLIEAKLKIKRILLKKYSTDQYVAFINTKGAKEYNWSEAWGGIDSSKIEVENVTSEEIDEQQKVRIIQDINLNNISKFIAKKKATEQVYYRKFGLDDITKETNNFIWEKDKPNNTKEKRKLSRCLILKRKPLKEKDIEAMRKFFDQKFEILSEQDMHRNLKQILESYLKLYELQMHHLK